MIEKYIRTDKIFHHPDRLLAYKTNKTILPVTVEIHLTNRCNINCYYCSFKEKHNKIEMATEDATMCIDKLQSMGVKGITLSGGGEPTLHKSYVELCAYAYYCGLDVSIITNGVILNVDVLKYLTWIRFSVDACNDEMYHRIKGVDRFDDVINNIMKAVEYRNMYNLGCTIGFQSVLNDYNIDRLDDMADCAEFIGVDYFQYRPVEGETIAKPTMGREHKIKVIESWYKWEEIQNAKSYTNCPGADFIGAVGADCNYYICCHHVGDINACYGNMLNSAIIENRKIIQDNFDYSKCPIACRGSVINSRLSQYNKIEHINFL
jgi:MoaA/NifB/PqqE/SkfB family radical SAM enzyme